VAVLHRRESSTPRTTFARMFELVEEGQPLESDRSAALTRSSSEAVSGVPVLA
jgi:hypothetical protein